MMIATAGICSQNVPASQPCASGASVMLDGSGAGGKVQRPFSRIVIGHHTTRIATITVVICMIRSALPLDSCTPLMFCHQK